MCAGGGEPILDGTNPVPNTYFTASSEDGLWYAYKAGMNEMYSWSPSIAELNANPPTCYLQVGLFRPP